MEAQQHRPHGNGYEDQDEVVLENKVGLKTALDDDPNASKEENTASNYQSKVTDPTGPNSEEWGTTPLVQSFEKMSVNEEKQPEYQEGIKSTKSTDRGVSNMKEYLAEKFKPRDEDKALSEVISGTLSGQKDKTVGSTEETGKALSEISGELSGQKDRTVGTEETGKVKKQAEVATHTGLAPEIATQTGPAPATHGEGLGRSSMMDRIKGAAASLWPRKGCGKQAAQQTPTSTPDGT